VEQIAWTLALGGFAGLVRYIQRFTVKRDERPPWELGVAAICVGTGSFVALLTLWLIGKSIEGTHVYFAIAVAGYGGPVTSTSSSRSSDAYSRAAQGGKNDAPKT
jgi:fluoride ion exporter CrcB/FEX